MRSSGRSQADSGGANKSSSITSAPQQPRGAVTRQSKDGCIVPRMSVSSPASQLLGYGAGKPGNASKVSSARRAEDGSVSVSPTRMKAVADRVPTTRASPQPQSRRQSLQLPRWGPRDGDTSDKTGSIPLQRYISKNAKTRLNSRDMNQVSQSALAGSGRSPTVSVERIRKGHGVRQSDDKFVSRMKAHHVDGNACLEGSKGSSAGVPHPAENAGTPPSNSLSMNSKGVQGRPNSSTSSQSSPTEFSLREKGGKDAPHGSAPHTTAQGGQARGSAGRLVVPSVAAGARGGNGAQEEPHASSGAAPRRTDEHVNRSKHPGGKRTVVFIPQRLTEAASAQETKAPSQARGTSGFSKSSGAPESNFDSLVSGADAGGPSSSGPREQEQSFNESERVMYLLRLSLEDSLSCVQKLKHLMVTRGSDHSQLMTAHINPFKLSNRPLLSIAEDLCVELNEAVDTYYKTLPRSPQAEPFRSHELALDQEGGKLETDVTSPAFGGPNENNNNNNNNNNTAALDRKLRSVTFQTQEAGLGGDGNREPAVWGGMCGTFGDFIASHYSTHSSMPDDTYLRDGIDNFGLDSLSMGLPASNEGQNAQFYPNLDYEGSMPHDGKPDSRKTDPNSFSSRRPQSHENFSGNGMYVSEIDAAFFVPRSGGAGSFLDGSGSGCHSVRPPSGSEAQNCPSRDNESPSDGGTTQQSSGVAHHLVSTTKPGDLPAVSTKGNEEHGKDGHPLGNGRNLTKPNFNVEEWDDEAFFSRSPTNQQDPRRPSLLPLRTSNMRNDAADDDSNPLAGGKAQDDLVTSPTGSQFFSPLVATPASQYSTDRGISTEKRMYCSIGVQTTDSLSHFGGTHRQQQDVKSMGTTESRSKSGSLATTPPQLVDTQRAAQPAHAQRTTGGTILHSRRSVPIIATKLPSTTT